MKSKVIFSALVSTLVIQSCSSNNEEPSKVPTPPKITLDNAMKDKDTTATPVHETTHQLSESPSSLQPEQAKSLLINDIKMQPSALPIVKGTRIFVQEVNQYAVATGDIVVVSQRASLPDTLKTTYDISAIATNTFKLTPVQRNADILAHYHALKKLEGIRQVELSIFYEGIHDNALEIK